MARPNSKTKSQIRGQITVILIMIIVLILVFMTVNWIVSQGAQEKRERAVKVQQLTKNKMAPMTDFVVSCLELATRGAVTKIGKQGGYLYESQGGPVPDFDPSTVGEEYARYDEHDIAYAILPPVGNAPGVWGAVPKYPYPTFPLKTRAGVTREDYQGYFGWNKLIQVFRPAENSVQEQLEHYITNKMIECADWSQFKVQNMNISALQPNVTIRLTKKETIADLYYPVNITELTTGSKGYISDFTVRVPVRLLTLFEFMNRLVSLDVAEGNFSVREARTPGITTQFVRDVHEKDYLIKLLDEESSMLDEDYEFRFMVSNRAPALHKVDIGDHANLLEEFTVCATVDEDGKNIDFAEVSISDNKLIIENAAGCEDDRIEIPLSVTEPDEHNTVFVFNTYSQNQKGVGPTKYAGREELGPLEIEEINNPDAPIEERRLRINLTVIDGNAEGRLADYQELFFKTHKKWIEY